MMPPVPLTLSLSCKLMIHVHMYNDIMLYIHKHNLPPSSFNIIYGSAELLFSFQFTVIISEDIAESGYRLIIVIINQWKVESTSQL